MIRLPAIKSSKFGMVAKIYQARQLLKVPAACDLEKF
jgi:hypothetical protein